VVLTTYDSSTKYTIITGRFKALEEASHRLEMVTLDANVISTVDSHLW